MFRTLSATALFVAVLAPAANAQVLIWSIPEKDGTSVRFEGEYSQVQERPLDKRGALSLKWRAELIVKSVGEEDAEFNGMTTKCRWIEFVSTIKPEGQKPGPSATRIYKVLVPVDRVTGQLRDAEDQPNDFVPIVKGYRKLGTADPVEVTEKALAVSPLIVPVVYYPDLKPESTEPAPVSLPSLGDIPAVLHQGQVQFTADTLRTTNKAKLWLSKDVPFGLAQFEVSVTHEAKDQLAKPEDFKQTSQIDLKMSAVEIGMDAQSDLPESK